MLPEAALLLDAPRVVDGRADGAEHAEGAPDERDRARDAERRRVSVERVELARDEFELRWKIPQLELENRVAILLVGGHASE